MDNEEDIEFDVNDNKLVFEFDNKEAALYFKRWLCNEGEYYYRDWMEWREREDETGEITGMDFDYWNGSKVRVRCGRVDEYYE